MVWSYICTLTFYHVFIGDNIYGGDVTSNNANDVVIEMEVDHDGGNHLHNNVIDDNKNQVVIDILDMVLPKNFVTSSIIVAPDGNTLQVDEAEENSLQKLQLVNNGDGNTLNQIQIVVNDVDGMGQGATEKEKGIFYTSIFKLFYISIVH